MDDLPSGVTPGPLSGTGHLLAPRPQQPIVAFPLLDSRSACAEALRAYLRCLIFVVDGKDAPNTPFQLLSVNREWPEPSQPMVLAGPGGTRRGICTVLDPAGGREDAWSLVPAPIEDSIDRYAPGTVLWKTAEMVVELQADLWFGNDPERQAVAAALPAAFAPGEDQWGIYAEAPSGYFGLPVRLSLTNLRRADEAGSVYPRERRLVASIKAEVSEVHLRRAVLTDLRVVLTTSDGPPEPTEDAEVCP